MGDTLKPLISVIIPVYNSEKYIKRCIDSLLLQSFVDFEILLIDDGSPDSSGKICDEYAKKDNRIHVFHKENGGVTSARKLGLTKSVGEYVMFVDSDDTLPSNAIMFLYTKLIKYGLDIVLGGWNKVGNKYKRIIPLTVNGIFSSNDYIKFLLLEKCYVGPVGRLIKRELFLENTFDISSEIIINEDLIMNIRLAKNSSRIGIYPFEIVYNYHQNEGSASSLKLTNCQCELLFSCVKNSIPNDFYELFVKYIIRFFHHHKYLDYKHNKYYNLLLNKKTNFKLNDKYYYYRNNLVKSGILWKILIFIIELLEKNYKLLFVLSWKITDINLLKR